MQESTEIKALLHLIDDPDDEVYDTVSSRIVSFGKAIIPNLEHLWETSTDNKLQERIEQLIHRLYFTDLCEEFTDWKKRGGDLLSGSLLVAKYHYPNIQSTSVLQEIEKLRRNIWLELNNYLTPMERIHVLNSIFYNYYKQIGVELNYEQPDPFLINRTLENKSGNVVSNGIIYLILCHLLDIPVQAVAIPRQFLLAYFDEQYDIQNPSVHPAQKILFFIDPLGGQVYTQKDIDHYFKRISVPSTPSYYRPVNTTRVLQILLEEVAKCFDNEHNQYKKEELISISKILDE